MLSTAVASSSEVAMANPLLLLTATCQGKDVCTFDGNDLAIEIRLTNKDSTAIGFPLAYRRKTGPIIKLIDPRTKAETNLKNNLADLDLRSEFTKIAPGESVSLRWVITADEVQQFGSRPLDIIAEITIAAMVQWDGNRGDFRGSVKLRIVGDHQ